MHLGPNNNLKTAGKFEKLYSVNKLFIWIKKLYSWTFISTNCHYLNTINQIWPYFGKLFLNTGIFISKPIFFFVNIHNSKRNNWCVKFLHYKYTQRFGFQIVGLSGVEKRNFAHKDVQWTSRIIIASLVLFQQAMDKQMAV